MAKVLVLGLDGFNPDFVMKWSNDLPNLISIHKEGIWGNLESTIPPAPSTAWTSALCGKNPGFFGFWDYHYRDDFSYHEQKRVSAEIIHSRVKPLYNLLPYMEQRTVIINVPYIIKPIKIPGGYCVVERINSNFTKSFTFPADFKEEINKLIDDYINVFTFSNKMNKEAILDLIYKIDEQRFLLLKYFLSEKKCDYICTIISGCEKLQNLFNINNKYNKYNFNYLDTLKKYYKFIDKNIKEIREVLPNDIVLIIHSCYSIQKLLGNININEWLVKNGYLRLFKYPNQPSTLKDLKVDWANTKAWATESKGNLYINLKDRENKGMVNINDYNTLLNELSSKIKEIPNENGQKLNIRIFKREEINFGPFSKFGPDLFLNFDNYQWNVSEKVGYEDGSLYSYKSNYHENNVSYGNYGYLSMVGPGIPKRGEVNGISLLNITPTIFEILALPIPNNMDKPSLSTFYKEKSNHHDRYEEKFRSRLEALGY